MAVGFTIAVEMIGWEVFDLPAVSYMTARSLRLSSSKKA